MSQKNSFLPYFFPAECTTHREILSKNVKRHMLTNESSNVCLYQLFFLMVQVPENETSVVKFNSSFTINIITLGEF